MEDYHEKHQLVLEDMHVENDQTYTTSSYVELPNKALRPLHQLPANLTIEGILDQTQVALKMENSDGTMINNRRVVEITTEESHAIAAKTMSKLRTNFDPIVQYDEELVLPLSKACAPLIDIVHNLFFYVQMALDKTPEEPPDGLTIDESAAIRLYTTEWKRPHRSLYCLLNQTLKEANHQNIRPYFKYLRLLVTAVVKLPCAPPMTIWRGVTKDVSGEFSPGTPVTWWGFSSCTASLPILENNMYLGNTGHRTLFSVEAINGRKIRAHSHFTTEDEILLLPGTQMIVQSQFSPAPGLHVVHLRQIIPDRVLLQPPFPGIVKISHEVFLSEIFLHLAAQIYPRVK